MRSLRTDQRGQAMVESALIMVVFLMILIAIFDFGQFLFFHQTLTERARHAVRYAGVRWDRGCQEECVRNMVVYRTETTPLDGKQAGDITVPRLTTANVQLLKIPDGTMDARITVSIVNYQFAVFTPWLSPTGSLRARGITASAPVEAPN